MARHMVKCGECGKEVQESRTTECMACLGRFHITCLTRVKKRRISYRICGNCLEQKPDPRRIVMGKTDIDIWTPTGSIKGRPRVMP